MGRKPCCQKDGKRGSWLPEEDAKLKDFIQTNMGNGGNWITLPSKAGLNRCGKSCRLRWVNYLRPDIIHGNFTEAETKTIIDIHEKVGNQWSFISKHLPGRTDNDIKNYWNTRLKKKVATKVFKSPLGHQQQIAYMRCSAAVPMFQSGLNLPLGNQQQCVHMRSRAAVPMIQSGRLSQDVIRQTHMSGYYHHQTMATQDVEQFQQGNYAIQRNSGNCNSDGNLPPLVETGEYQFPRCSREGQLHESLLGDDFSIGNIYGDPLPSEDASSWVNTILSSNLSQLIDAIQDLGKSLPGV